jgi:hypothetical protein
METKKGLDLLREPFIGNQISKLPKGTKAQNECAYEKKKRCTICKGFHHPDIIHLDYVGHAALTDRLLDTDMQWSWKPLAVKEGLPAFDEIGGLWIELTVCGMTRIGYGNAEKSNFKSVGDREKEVIGDALRNAAMRFGAALDLWHKGDLHTNDEDKPEPKAVNQEKDVPLHPGESEPNVADKNVIDFINSDLEGKIRTLTVLTIKHKYAPKKEPKDMDESEQLKYYRFLLTKEK